MRILRIELEASAGSADQLESAAYALGVQGLEIVDESTGGPAGRASVRFYVPEGAEAERALRALRKALPRTTIRTSLVEDEPERIATPECQHPVLLGRGFVVAPDDSPTRGRTRLLVDPSAAFGDGVHPTTLLVVSAMEEHLGATRPTRALDVGSGTGVLSLVALLLGVREVVATDVDALARSATKLAARRHGFSSRLSVRSTIPRATFPLVVANLYRDVLLQMAPRLSAGVARRGTLVVSGFATGSRRDVVATFESHGLGLVSSRSRSGWCVVTLRRP